MDTQKNVIAKVVMGFIIALNLSLVASFAAASDGLLPASFDPVYVFAAAGVQIVFVLLAYRATKKQLSRVER